jgi:hypothetical protein
MASEWFPHDSSAGTDVKLTKLRAKYGCRYYGMYWLTLEWLYQNVDSIGEYDIAALSFHLREDEETTKEFIDYCISIDLFINDNGSLYSLRLKEQKEKQNERSETARTNVLRRYNKRSYGGTTIREEKRREEKNTKVSGKPDGFDFLISEYLRMSGRKSMQPTAKRDKSLAARIKEFSIEDIRKAWAEMSTHPFLRGENSGGKDYFTPDYAFRSDRIEFYLNEYTRKHATRS